ncbi:hypothetical protein LCGC14_1653220 [marine sediment metagenome]|uniref:Uncharacterized protein n=1 Tax=marine sediment metagenome TaxID=412755 RepID=A0A0F9HWA0_9ZZZZ
MSEVPKATINPEVTNTPSVTEEVIMTEYERRIIDKVSSEVWTQDEADKAIKVFSSIDKTLKTYRNTGMKVSLGIGNILSNNSYVNLFDNAEDLTQSCYGLTIGLGPLANIDNTGKCIFKGDKDFVNLVLSGYPTNRAKELFLKKDKLLAEDKHGKSIISRSPFGIEINDKSLKNARNLGELKASIKNILNPNKGSNNGSLSSHNLWTSCRSISKKLAELVDRQSEINLNDDEKNIEIAEFLVEMKEAIPQLQQLLADKK